MKTMNTNSSHLADGPIRVFEDASGAPVVLRYNGYAFAFDYLGEVKCNNIAPRYGSRVACKVAKDVCEREYRAILEAATTPEWRKANEELYAA
jgi:hypothetical protein